MLLKCSKSNSRACKNGTDKQLGYPQTQYSSYSMSKIGLNALTKVQQKTIDLDTNRKGIVISCVCPGYCKTDLTRGGGILSAAQG
jgi:carbonyl reductase 1